MKMDVFPRIEDGGHIELKTRYKYGMWGANLKDFELKHRTLSYCLLNMENNVFQAARSTILMRYLWTQIRTTFSFKTQRHYDKMFKQLEEVAREHAEEYRILCAYSYPNVPPNRTDPKLVQAIENAYMHLKALADKSGFGNKMIRNYDLDEYAQRNMLE